MSDVVLLRTDLKNGVTQSRYHVNGEHHLQTYTLPLHTASIYSRTAIRTRILLKCAIKKIHAARLLFIVIPFGFNEPQPPTLVNALTQAKQFLSSQIIFYIKVTSPVCRYHRTQLQLCSNFSSFHPLRGLVE